LDMILSQQYWVSLTKVTRHRIYIMLDSPVTYCIMGYWPTSLIYRPVKCREHFLSRPLTLQMSWKHYHIEACFLQKFRVQFSPAVQLKFVS
jgi:hypothetical protein